MARRTAKPAANLDPTALVSSAAVLTASTPNLRDYVRADEWQQQAWDYYDTVGELRFGAGWVGNALSRVRLTAATVPTKAGAAPEPLDSGPAFDMVSALAGGPGGQSQMQLDLGIALTIPGVAYVVATGDETGVLTWYVHSDAEIRAQGSMMQRMTGPNEWADIDDEQDLVVKVWRSHPRLSWLPDSPVRACLPTLAEIELLTAHVAATAQSRLAGAGILVVPSEAVFPKSDPEAAEDDFVPTLLETMTVPIKDRSSAAAVVPLVVRIPAQYAESLRHIAMSTPFDDRVLELRTAAIQRLALGLDMPPEVLTGLGGSNHWNAWAIQDEAITLHVEPLMEVICHAFTIGFLRPALRALGVTNPDEFLVWYDTTDLRVPPDRTEAAFQLHDRVILSDEALIRETGFADTDVPSPDERTRRLVEKLVLAHPELLATGAIADLLGLEPTAAPAAPIEVSAAPVEPPAPAEPTETPPELPARAASGASDRMVMLAADLLVIRALERAGTKLRSRWQGPRTDGPTHELHCAIHQAGTDPTSVVDLDSLLAGAWAHAGSTAAHLGVDEHAFVGSLDAYVRAVLATGVPHDRHRLAAALGLTSTH